MKFQRLDSRVKIEIEIPDEIVNPALEEVIKGLMAELSEIVTALVEQPYKSPMLARIKLRHIMEYQALFEGV